MNLQYLFETYGNGSEILMWFYKFTFRLPFLVFYFESLHCCLPNLLFSESQVEDSKYSKCFGLFAKLLDLCLIQLLSLLFLIIFWEVKELSCNGTSNPTHVSQLIELARGFTQAEVFNKRIWRYERIMTWKFKISIQKQE